MAAKIASKLVKPPVALFGLEGKYINALFSAASKKNCLSAVEGDLAKVVAEFKKSPTVKDYLLHPFIKPQDKVNLFKEFKLNEVSSNFIYAMAEHNRLKFLPAFEETLRTTMAAYRKEIHCTVTSAKPLTEAKKKEIENSLQGFTEKKLLLTYAVDGSLLGGLVINFNNEHLIDMSIKSKVRSITYALESSS